MRESRAQAEHSVAAACRAHFEIQSRARSSWCGRTRERSKGVGAELLAACRNSGLCAGSIEELAPLQHDPMTFIPLAMASVATLIRPTSWSWLASGSVENYALTPTGWEQILAEIVRVRRRSNG